MQNPKYNAGFGHRPKANKLVIKNKKFNKVRLDKSRISRTTKFSTKKNRARLLGKDLSKNMAYQGRKPKPMIYRVPQDNLKVTSYSDSFPRVPISRKTKKETSLSNNLRVTFLGGIGEIGKNMTVMEYGKDMIIIDAGQSFPDSSLPGVQQIVQDITYLEQNQDRIRGIFITHGHEDHIGGIPYLMRHIRAPIYGSKVSLGLIDNKLREAKITGVVLKPVQGRSVVVAGSFRIEFVSVTHSIPGSFALVITTPACNVVYTGDFKIDFTPIGHDICDLKRLAEVGKEGVTLLLAESTNVEREGFSMSETKVKKTFEDLFNKFKTRRIIIAIFASNIYRMQQIIYCAEKYNRKVAFTGRSMVNVSDMAIKLGELKCNEGTIVDIDKIDTYMDKELTILSTGSQGEAMSALMRIVSNKVPKIKLTSNDVVILSSSPIPGNERAIDSLINAIYRKGAKVIYSELADVHASGHAYKEELRILHSIVRPKFFIPIHGEYRHLKNHQILAKEMGMRDEDIIIPELGMQVEVNKNMMKMAGAVEAGDLLIDGTGVGHRDSNVIKDRLALAKGGLCVVIVTMSLKSGQILKEPDIFSRGFIYPEESETVMKEAKTYIYSTLGALDLKAMPEQEIRKNIQKIAMAYFYKKTKRRPVILPIITEAK